MFDMRSLPTAATTLPDLTEQDQLILRYIAEGLSPREIARLMHVSEEQLYRLVVWVLDELEPAPDGITIADVHARHGSRAASPARSTSSSASTDRRYHPTAKAEAVTEGGGRRNAPVHFDDALFEADVARLPEHARAALRSARPRLERDGVPASERRRCEAAHPSGTDLPGCMKVYVPDFQGPWRIVLQVALLPDGALGLEYLAAGRGHVPSGTRRLPTRSLPGAWLLAAAMT